MDVLFDTAANTAGYEVPSHARIIQPPKDVAVLDGDDALFFCGVDGSPTPNVNFFLDGQPGRLSNDIGKIVPVSGGSLLRLFKVSSKQNGMKIECLASNHVGNDRSSANLKVYKYTDDVPSGFPKFTLPPKPLSADVGKRVRLECEAEGDPPVAFLWLKNGVPVQNSPGSSPKESAHVVNAAPQQYTGRSSLVLENLDVSDDGQYECLASNSHGAVLSARVHLRVRNVPPPPVDLECFSRGPTYAILRWLPGKPLQDPASRTFVPITSYTLILTELESTSGQPMKRQITDISPWKINNDGSVHLKVIDLKPDRRYAANVYAVSLKFGMSDGSNTVTFSTSELPPGGPPQAIHATANTMDSITVNWQPPSEPNGKILGYNLYYSMQLRAQLDRWEVVKTTQSHATLRGLRYGATYFLKVNAFNSAGDGPVSEAFPIIVTPGVPPQPINFRGVSISPTAIQLVWSPPELSHGMNILDYHLRCRSAGGTRPAPFQNAAVTPPLSISIPAKHTGYVVEGLQPDTLYQISLAARTKHGSGVATHVEIRTLSNGE
ncbi:protein tyrosine phosphatase activity [Sparganum proliferum]